MKNCTFFGHANTEQNVIPFVEKVIKDLIIYEDVVNFYIGVDGNFDRICYRVLKELKTDFDFIEIHRVLAYMPSNAYLTEDSVFPEGIERVPKRVAIAWRNRWMIDRCEFVVAYVNKIAGGAHKFMNMALDKGLTVINIADWYK